MPVHTVSFRLHSDASYQDRYDSLIDAISKYIGPLNCWSETTSFYVVNYAGDAAMLATVLVNNSEIDLRKDHILIIDLTNKNYELLGAYDDQAILNIMSLL